MTWQLIQADCIEAMSEMDEASVDAIVTDPPYGLEFMGKEWDSLQAKGRGARVRERRAAEMTPSGQGHTGSKGPYLAAGVDWQGVNQSEMQTWHEAWATAALRVLKPGGHLLAFGGTRTIHRLVCAIEDAGFEIRDMLSWLYGSGFPKSLNIGNGYGTALKPAWEGIGLARKPLVGSVASNVQTFGVGVLNIDGTRIEGSLDGDPDRFAKTDGGAFASFSTPPVVRAEGRWPANVVLGHSPACEPPCDECEGTHVHCAEDCAVRLLDEQTGERTPPGGPGRQDAYPSNGVTGWAEGKPQGPLYLNESGGASRFFKVIDENEPGQGRYRTALENLVGDVYLYSLQGDGPEGREISWAQVMQTQGEGIRALSPREDAEDCGHDFCPWGGPCAVETEPESRFRYVPKADREERDRGLEHRRVQVVDVDAGHHSRRMEETKRFDGAPPAVGRNVHPTVKPVELMRWLCRLVTPPGGTVLDPFTGSGSTGIAALREGFNFVGIEREADYVEIARDRIIGDAPMFNVPAEVV